MRGKDGRFSKKHGLYGTRIYNIWNSMKSRCYCNKDKDYCLYGGRGIKVCEEWKKDVGVFYNWAIKNGYSDSLTLDRINYNGDYSPDNCRWITSFSQQRNRRNNHRVSFMGEVFCLSEWEEILGISRKTLNKRIRRGWNIEDALLRPVEFHKKHSVAA